MKPFIPQKDLSGQPIADLSRQELERRIANLTPSDRHPITTQYLRAYRALLEQKTN